MKEHTASLEKRLLAVEGQIKRLTSPQQSKPYYLHAILNHEGKSDYGHYYSFIYDRKGNQWYKFDDFKVAAVNEAEVFASSLGDPKSATQSCAYALVYVN